MRNFVVIWRKICENFTEPLKYTRGNYKKFCINFTVQRILVKIRKNLEKIYLKFRENFIKILRESCKNFEEVIWKFRKNVKEI